MFIERLTELCNEAGISLSAAANAVGLNKSNVTFWKRGSKPSGDTIRKLADYFNVSVDYLLGLSSVRERVGENDMLRLEEVVLPVENAGTWIELISSSGECRRVRTTLQYEQLINLAEAFSNLAPPDQTEMLEQMKWRRYYRDGQAKEKGLTDYIVISTVDRPNED